MSLIRAIGILLVMGGLVLVGISGDNHSAANGRNITAGASLMLLGAIAAVFGG